MCKGCRPTLVDAHDGKAVRVEIYQRIDLQVTNAAWTHIEPTNSTREIADKRFCQVVWVSLALHRCQYEDSFIIYHCAS